jgi:tetratricopeptide (TPR) repeat protein
MRRPTIILRQAANRFFGEVLEKQTAEQLDLRLAHASMLLDADPRSAARTAAEILAASPGHAAATLLLATACREFGDYDTACRALEALADEQPGSAIIQLELARAHKASGKAERAITALRRALELAPELGDAWRELSTALAALGDAPGADRAFARYAELTPQSPLLLEPAAALAENRLRAAEQLLRRHLDDAPEDIDAIRMLAAIAVRRDGYIEAERLLQRALELAPGYAAARYDLAQMYLTQQKMTPLPPLIDRLLLLDASNADYRHLQASFLSFIGQHHRSIEIFGALLADTPAEPSAWVNMGHELRAAGRQSESVNAYEQAIALAPTSGAAYWSLANLKTFRFGDADIDAMRGVLLRPDLSDYDRATMEFALAKALEDLECYAEAFEHYARGNSLRQRALNYDPDKLSDFVRRSRRIFNREFFIARAGWGSQAADPIFIVGMPRAGSTLLEQVLASHSLVEGTRELADLSTIARELGDTKDKLDPFAYLNVLEQIDAAKVAGLALQYLDETRMYRPRGLPRFIDKMPNNFLHVGLIQLMFPRAAIIDARRHPLGCCFSCFKQYFGMGQAFTYGLERVGGYYRQYVELMAHFDAVLPGRVLRVNYESVVADLEGEVSRVLTYCGLAFEEECLHFHRNTRVVQTASSEQVRRPIFSEGLHHWRHFEPWLGPLKEALGDVLP